MRIRRRLSSEAAIPVVAMADVTFLLIAFFLLTSTFAKDTGLNIDLPSAETAKSLPKKEVTIWVERDGYVHLGKQKLPGDPRVVELALRKALAESSTKSVTIRGDQGVTYGRIMTIMDIAQKNGAAITLAARFGGSPNPPLPPAP